jgi:hypothetical protein
MLLAHHLRGFSPWSLGSLVSEPVLSPSREHTEQICSPHGGQETKPAAGRGQEQGKSSQGMPPAPCFLQPGPTSY